MTEIERLGWYFAEYYRVFKAWIPILVTGLVFAVIVWLIIYITRKMVDRQWLREPEKLRKATKVKLDWHLEYIAKMEKTLDRWRKENDDLRAAYKLAIEHIRQTENIFRGKL